MFNLYLLFAGVVSLYLTRKVRCRLFGFALVFWMLAQPVLTYRFPITIPGIHIDLQANRIMLLFLSVYMFFVPRLQIEESAVPLQKKLPRFEFFFYTYLILVIISLVVNITNIRAVEAITVPLEIITFILMYKSTRNYMDTALFNSILNALIILCVTGALIAFFQYAVNPDIMRTTQARVAYGDIWRASGIFSQEYDFGTIQALGITAILLRYRGKMISYILLSFCAASVLLTFHRMDIIIMMICFILYFWYLTSATKKTIVLSSLVLFSVIILVILPYVSSSLSNTTFSKTAEGRLQQNTITGRFSQYEVAIRTIFTNYRRPVGFGSYTNPSYDRFMIATGHGHITEDGSIHGYRIHNGFLEVGVLYGLPAMCMFTLIMIKMLIYFKRMKFNAAPLTLLPMFAIIIWMFSNFSNGLSSYNIYFSLMCAVISGMFVGAYRNGVVKNEALQ